MKRYHRLKYVVALLELAAQPIYLGLFAFTFLRPTSFAAVLAVLTGYIIVSRVFAYLHYRLRRGVGLSHQKFKEWLGDQIISLGLSLAIAAGITTILYTLLIDLPQLWWFAAATLFAIFMVLVTYIAPVLLLPIFNEFVPLDNEELGKRLLMLSKKVGIPVLGIYVMDMGRRTVAANAMLTGAFTSRRIILSDTLIANFSGDEIETVMAHELGHHYYNHIPKGIALAALSALCMLYLIAPIIDTNTPFVSIIQVYFYASLALLLGLPFTNLVSRYFEKQCDFLALKLTNKKDAFISNMTKLGERNVSDSNPNILIKLLLFSHPPISERIKLAREYQTGGEGRG